MKPRAQLKHALIRVNLLNLAKVRALKRLFGITSKLALVEVYLTMSCATNAVISKDAILDIAEDNEVQDPEGFFTYCLKEGLIQPEMDGFSNSVVIEDQEAYAKKLKKKPEEPPTEDGSLPDSPGKIPGNSPDKNGLPDNDNDTDNDLDLEKITVSGSEAVLGLPDALNRWQKHLKNRYRRNWGQFDAESLFAKYQSSNALDSLVKDIHHAITSNWDQVWFTRDKERPPKVDYPKTPAPRSTVKNAAKTDAVIASIKAGTSEKPITQILTPELLKKLEKVKGVA